MPRVRSARRVLTIATGIAAILDPTGTAVYRTLRPVLPRRRPGQDDLDPFQAAMDTIMTAHSEVVGRAPERDGAGTRS
jgi:hypothetical protein